MLKHFLSYSIRKRLWNVSFLFGYKHNPNVMSSLHPQQFLISSSLWLPWSSVVSVCQWGRWRKAEPVLTPELIGPSIIEGMRQSLPRSLSSLGSDSYSHTLTGKLLQDFSTRICFLYYSKWTRGAFIGRVIYPASHFGTRKSKNEAKEARRSLWLKTSEPQTSGSEARGSWGDPFSSGSVLTRAKTQIHQ